MRGSRTGRLVIAVFAGAVLASDVAPVSAAAQAGAARVDAAAAASVLDKWADAFDRGDHEALVSLYSERALFYGATPALRRGKAGVRAYFAAFPKAVKAQVKFTQVVVEAIRPDVINVAALATFATESPPATRAMRLTLLLVSEDGVWRIAGHHVSDLAGVPAPPQPVTTTSQGAR